MKMVIFAQMILTKFADIYIGWPALIVYSLSFVVFIPGSSLWIRESLHIKWSAVLCFVGQKLVYSVSMATFSPNQIVQLACISQHLRIFIVQYYVLWEAVLNRSALSYQPVPNQFAQLACINLRVITGQYNLSVKVLNRSALGYAEVSTNALYTPYACLFFAFLW